MIRPIPEVSIQTVHHNSFHTHLGGATSEDSEHFAPRRIQQAGRSRAVAPARSNVVTEMTEEQDQAGFTFPSASSPRWLSLQPERCLAPTLMEKNLASIGYITAYSVYSQRNKVR